MGLELRQKKKKSLIVKESYLDELSHRDWTEDFDVQIIQKSYPADHHGLML